MPVDDDITSSETVDLSAIESTPVKIPKPQNGGAKSELDQLNHEDQTFRNELGLLGKPFGGRREKPGNISGLVIVACFAMMITAYIYPPGEGISMSFEQIFSGLLSVVTLILGYLFGSNDKS